MANKNKSITMKNGRLHLPKGTVIDPDKLRGLEFTSVIIDESAFGAELKPALMKRWLIEHKLKNTKFGSLLYD